MVLRAGCATLWLDERDARRCCAPVTCEEEGLVGCAQHHWAIVAGSANGPHHLLAEPEVGVEAVEVPLYLGEGAWGDTTESGWKSLGGTKAPEVVRRRHLK